MWIGQEGFEELVVALWRNLWPEARKRFAFRISFSPQDVADKKQTIVATPEKQAQRWFGFDCVRPNDRHEPNSLSEFALLGLPEGRPLIDLRDSLGATLASIPDLKILEKCYEGLRQLDKESAGALRTLAHRLGRMSPDDRMGSSIKNKAFEALAEKTEQGSATDILGLRTLNTGPFVNGQRRIEKAIDAWMRSNIHVSQKDIALTHAELLCEAFQSPNPIWNEAVMKSVKRALSSWKKSTPSAMWIWWQRYPDLVDHLESFLPKDLSTEHLLVDTSPAYLDKSLGKRVRTLAEKRAWYSLHAVVVTTYLPPADAIGKQLEVDQDPGSKERLCLLATKIELQDLVTQAIVSKDNRLIEVAGEISVKHPNLLSSFDVGDETWRAIWLHRIESGGEPWVGIEYPRQTMHELLDMASKGVRVNEALFLHLAETSQGDLTDYPRRQELWKKLSAPVAKAFLESTADAWIERYKAMPGFDAIIDKDLENVIFGQDRRGKLLDPSHNQAITVAVGIFSTYDRLTSNDFNAWLDKYLDVDHHLKRVDAIQIGQLVKQKRWSQSASHIGWQIERWNRRDLQPAIKECLYLLGIIDRLFYGFRLGDMSLSHDEWWEALTAMAVMLYPEGLRHHKIWERAGGDLAVVRMDVPPRTQWEEALRMLRHGGGGDDIRPQKLIKKMKKDFRHPVLDILSR